jgi:hypothetical protein
MHDWRRRISGKPSPPCAQEPEKALLVLGSGKTRLGSRASWIAQIEEWLFVAPRVFGSGRPLFQDVQESIRLKLGETQQVRSGVVLLQSQREGLEEPFGSHSIGKERHHEISAHLGWHQQRQHS